MYYPLEHAPVPLLWVIAVGMIVLGVWDTWRKRDRQLRDWKFHAWLVPMLIGMGLFLLLPFGGPNTPRHVPFSVMMWSYAVISAVFAVYLRRRAH